MIPLCQHRALTATLGFVPAHSGARNSAFASYTRHTHGRHPPHATGSPWAAVRSGRSSPLAALRSVNPQPQKWLRPHRSTVLPPPGLATCHRSLTRFHDRFYRAQSRKNLNYSARGGAGRDKVTPGALRAAPVRTTGVARGSPCPQSPLGPAKIGTQSAHYRGSSGGRAATTVRFWRAGVRTGGVTRHGAAVGTCRRLTD